MAYWYDQTAKVVGKQVKFFCDGESDVADLPTSSNEGEEQTGDTLVSQKVAKGSRAFVIATGATYYLDSTDNWVLPTPADAG